jgi:hypothetical protein
MDPYTNECMQCIYGIGQPCLTLVTNYTKVTYDNYNTTWINEALIINFFVNILQLLAKIIII